MKQLPVFNVPPMPKPEDFGVNWNDARDRTWSATTDAKFSAQMKAYEMAVQAWKEAVAALGQSFK